MNRERVHAARRHAKARASARFGVVLNSEALAKVVVSIQRGASVHLWNETNDRRWHLVDLAGKPAVAVYGKRNQMVHTFLTIQQAREKLALHSAIEALSLLPEAM